MADQTDTRIAPSAQAPLTTVSRSGIAVRLKRYFELEVFAREAPDEVRFEASEFERAVQTRGDYFLAVVSGLEEGYDTQIKIFANPVRTLQIRRFPQIRLGGVRAASSRRLVVNIKTPSSPTS